MFRSKLRDPIIGRATAVINSSPEAIFDFIGVDFFVNYPRWSPEVVELEQLTDGPVGVGTLARQVRIDQRHRLTSKFRVTEFAAGRRLAFAGVPDPFRCTYDLAESANGQATDLTFTFEGLELRPHMRPFEKLIRHVVQDGAARTTRNLKRLIERASRSQPAYDSTRTRRYGAAR
jgi:hypothetical protein